MAYSASKTVLSSPLQSRTFSLQKARVGKMSPEPMRQLDTTTNFQTSNRLGSGTARMAAAEIL